MTPWALPVVLALLVGTTACGGTGDAGAVEVQTGLGIMDCPAAHRSPDQCSDEAHVGPSIPRPHPPIR
jgi:hypothetical protein